MNDFTPDVADVEENKTIAGLAYLLFFLPLISAPESEYAKFHANQGLILAILAIGGNIVLTLIPFIGWALLPFFGIFLVVLLVIGMMNGFGGKVKELPLIGKFKIIK